MWRGFSSPLLLSRNDHWRGFNLHQEQWSCLRWLDACTSPLVFWLFVNQLFQKKIVHSYFFVHIPADTSVTTNLDATNYRMVVSKFQYVCYTYQKRSYKLDVLPIAVYFIIEFNCLIVLWSAYETFPKITKRGVLWKPLFEIRRKYHHCHINVSTMTDRFA